MIFVVQKQPRVRVLPRNNIMDQYSRLWDCVHYYDLTNSGVPWPARGGVSPPIQFLDHRKYCSGDPGTFQVFSFLVFMGAGVGVLRRSECPVLLRCCACLKLTGTFVSVMNW